MQYHEVFLHYLAFAQNNDQANVSFILFPILFANDTNVFLSGKNMEMETQYLNKELEKIVKCLQLNKL